MSSKFRSASVLPAFSSLAVPGVLIMTGCTSSITPLADMRGEVAGIIEQDVTASDADVVLVVVADGFVTALRDAVRGNDAFQGALALERQALSGIDVAESVRRPQVTGALMSGVVRGEQGGELGAGGTGQLSISRLIYDGGATAATINQATAQAIIAQSNRENMSNELALEAARAWIDVWQYQERLNLLSMRTAEMQELLSHIERMANNGMIDRSMLEDARRQIIAISLEQRRLEAALGDAEVRFERLFRVRASSLPAPTEIISLEMARQEAENWRDAPILQGAAAEVIVAENAISLAEAAFRPRASIQAAAGTPMDSGETTEASIGLSLQYTFADGGRRRAEVEAAVSRLDAVRAELGALRSNIEAEIQSALVQLDAIQRTTPLLQENIRLSESSVEIARSQIATGQSNLQQLVDAEIESYRSNDALIEMQSERLLMQFTIAARTGALARSLGISPPIGEIATE